MSMGLEPSAMGNGFDGAMGSAVVVILACDAAVLHVGLGCAGSSGICLITRGYCIAYYTLLHLVLWCPLYPELCRF